MTHSKSAIRLGEFHTAMSYLAIIGKCFQDSGLQDILIASETVATGSINGVLSGHHYNRSIRAYKLMFESLQILRWNAFLSTLSQDERQDAQSTIKQLAEVGATPAFPERL